MEADGKEEQHGKKLLDKSSTEKQTPLETGQREKERLACELWIEGLTKGEIAKRIKKQCNLTDEPGVDALTNWAENHWQREHTNEPFPRRKAGRHKNK